MAFMRGFVVFFAMTLAASAVAQPLSVVEHLVDGAQPAAVRCEGGAALARAGGAVFRVADGRVERLENAPWPDQDAERGARAAALAARAPRRDRLLHSGGLRAAPRGAAAAGDGEICWYGDAAPGLTLHAGGAWRDLVPGETVYDAAVDGDRVWAVGPTGLFHVPLAGGAAQPVALPAWAPGNALDGAFRHDGQLHVFGPRGLFALTRSPTATFAPLLSTPVISAAVVPGGIAAITGSELRFLPGSTAYPVAVGGTWAVAGTRDRRVYLASAHAVASIGPGRPAPVEDVPLPAPPRALFGTGDTLAVALAGSAGGVLVARTRIQGGSSAQELARLELTALCFAEGPAGLYVGTPDGLASIEGDRVHWYLQEPGLAVTAVARAGDRLVLAVPGGLALLDGPVVTARLPLGDRPEARVTALVSHDGDLWAATAGQGLYRIRVAPEAKP